MTRLRTTIAIAVALGFLLANPSPSQAERPWAKGVSPDDQRKALKLFREANKLLRESLFAKSVVTYREAIKHWDHPAIHYNLVLALLPLDKPLEAYASLEKAMKYGEAPLDKDKFDRAKSYKILIGRQIAKVEISCNTPGAKITLDGKELFVAPGKWSGLVKVGDHTVVGSKAGFLTYNKKHNMKPGQDFNLDVKLLTVADVTRYRRKWAKWKPWSVVGGGGAFILLGGVLHALAKSNFGKYDDAVKACGGAPECAVPSNDIQGKKSSGETQQGLAFASYFVGLAAVAAGATLVYMNRAQPYRIDLERRGRVAIEPILSPKSAGVSATLRF